MKKIILTVFCGICCLLAGVSVAEDLSAFNRPDYRIGTWKGTSFVPLAAEKLPLATLVFFKDSNANLIEALQKDKIDGFLTDRITAVDLLKDNPDLMIEKTPIATTQFAMAFHPENTALREEFAAVIRDMKSSGKLKKLQDTWFSDDDTRKKSTISPHGKRGVLRVGTASVNPPFSFFMNNKLVGIEIELVNEIARRLDYGVDWTIADHVSFIDALRKKEMDVYASLITVTPERAKLILFGEPDYEDTVVMVSKKN